MQTDNLLTPQEAADRLRITERALKDMRNSGQGPRHLRLGHKTVRYREADVVAWLAAR